ncbi:hypothetical protein LDC_1315 [sediment metagenome]|uniref:Uncharacterized protein n=1 Tax=sediment metagenome TaxID=749907 RepID=D9PIF7_9ZZZZ
MGLGVIIYVFGAFMLESTINMVKTEAFCYSEYIAEEMLEMAGAIFMIKGIAAYLGRESVNLSR